MRIDEQRLVGCERLVSLFFRPKKRTSYFLLFNSPFSTISLKSSSFKARTVSSSLLFSASNSLTRLFNSLFSSSSSRLALRIISPDLPESSQSFSALSRKSVSTCLRSFSYSHMCSASASRMRYMVKRLRTACISLR